MQLKFKASKKQWVALWYLTDNITTEIWYWWWAWWGKSFLWVFRVWMYALQYPNTRRFFGRKELTNLKKTTLATYYKLMAEYEIPEVSRWVLNSQDNIIRFTNWSEILLLDLAHKPSDPLYTRFWSLELTWWFIDESNEIDQQCITILNTRVWRQYNKKYNLLPKILETFNPDKWHVYSRYYKPYKSGTLPTYRQFIPALAVDNPHIEQVYIEQLKKADEITKQRLLYGNFDYDDESWSLFRHDEILDLFSSTVIKSDVRYMSVDVARLWKDNTIITIREWLECWEIIKYNWYTTDQTAQAIKEFEVSLWIPRRNIIIDTDWVWWWVADQVRWCVNFINNSRPTDHNFINLKTQCYYKLRDLMEKRLVRVIADWDIREKLSQELSNIKVKNPDKDQKTQLESKEEMKKRLWRSPDIADSIMMRMYYELISSEWEDEGVYNVDIRSFILW